MNVIEIGIRMKAGNGIAFFGIDEANAVIQRGARIVAIRNGEAFFTKMGEDDKEVRLAFSGGSIRLVLDTGSERGEAERS